MAFKTVDIEDLKTKIGPNFIGMPLRIAENKEMEIDNSFRNDNLGPTGKFSEIVISNEESLEFQYNYNKERKSLLGYGNISVFNNSKKDRIWDSFLQFSGSDNVNVNSHNEMNLGVLEPQSKKMIKYDLINTENLPDMIRLEEDIEILDDNPLNSENSLILSDQGDIAENANNRQTNHFIKINKENMIRFSIKLENTSEYSFAKIKMHKEISKEFRSFEFKSDLHRDIKILKNKLEWNIPVLRPGEITELILDAKVFPKKKIQIRSGKIEISYSLIDSQLSGIEINKFTAYSHAMHIINVAEKDTEPNLWECFLSFENLSDFKLNLNSITIKDKSKLELLKIDFNSLNEKQTVMPNNNYTTNSWEISDSDEPKFSRKVDYTVVYNVQNFTRISSMFDDTEFKIIGLQITKEISKGEIKSFEKAQIGNEITIRNLGSVPIKGILLKESFPEDFLPPGDILEYKLSSLSGELKVESFSININPPDEDASKEHELILNINLEENHLKHLIGVDDVLRLNYSINAVSPDYRKVYDFPVEVNSYFLKGENQDLSDLSEYYLLKDKLTQLEKTSLNVTHKRRKLAIGKAILPGRNSNEFAINILVRNKSNVEMTDVFILDSFPNSFQFISSNVPHKLNKSNVEGNTTISFSIESILPYQEKDIRFYLKNETGKDMQYSELESILYG